MPRSSAAISNGLMIRPSFAPAAVRSERSDVVCVAVPRSQDPAFQAYERRQQRKVQRHCSLVCSCFLQPIHQGTDYSAQAGEAHTHFACLMSRVTMCMVRTAASPQSTIRTRLTDPSTWAASLWRSHYRTLTMPYSLEFGFSRHNLTIICLWEMPAQAVKFLASECWHIPEQVRHRHPLSVISVSFAHLTWQ